MKRQITLLALSLFFGDAYAQEKDTSIKNETIVCTYPIVEKAYYTSGTIALRDTIKKLLKNPTQACVQGIVIVEFRINEDGTTEDFKIERGIHPILDEEALRVAKLLKGWTPQKHKGEPRRSLYKLPISFNHFVYE